jgi:hypothetical protein
MNTLLLLFCIGLAFHISLSHFISGSTDYLIVMASNITPSALVLVWNADST